MIAQSVFDRSHMGTSFSPEKRAEQEKEAFEQDIKELRDAQVPEVMIERYEKRYELYLTRKGRTLSPMITGPARFPVERNRKALDAENRAWEDLQAYREKCLRIARKEKRKEAIEEAGGELAIAEKELAKEEKHLNMMKAANKVIRSKPKNEVTEKKLRALEDIGFKRENMAAMFAPDFCGRIGFPDYALTNCRARIKGKQARVDQLKAREERKDKPAESFPFDGGEIRANYVDNRLEIHHEEKPERDTIKKLKSSGFRWSRSKICWQRQLTQNALWAAKNICGI